MCVRKELWFRTEDFAGGGCLGSADLALRSPEESSVAPERRAVGADDLVPLPGQGGDEPTSPGLGIVRVPTEDDHTQLSAGVIIGMERDDQADCREQSDH